MATCFLNNVYCCYLPAHCSHGLQPLDNGVFNASKAAYRKELQKLTCLTDSAPVDKVNFIRAYAKAREVGMTAKNILSGWRVTGNWPISRSKALRHPEIHAITGQTSPKSVPFLHSDDTPRTSRQVRDIGKNKTPSTRRRLAVIAKGFEAQEQALAEHSNKIAKLEAEVARLQRGKKRRAIPNPNRRFMTLGEVLAAKEAIPQVRSQEIVVVLNSETDEDEVSDAEIASVIEVKVAHEAHSVTTRSGRVVKKSRRV
jgi:hypothetical protein